ncbi:MAG: hypothetical protein XFASWVDF_001835 [Candidatus Fervidibacter sp.]
MAIGSFCLRWVFISCLAVMLVVAVRLAWQPQPEPLPLHAIAWSWRDKIKALLIVDLDADGRDEIVFRDANGWWWAEWDGQAMTPQKMPIPAKASVVCANRFGLPSNILVASLENQPASRNNPAIRNLWLVTRAKGEWRTLSRKGRRTMTVTDWDGNGRADDALLLLDERTMEWWQQDNEGNIRWRVRQRLPDNIALSKSAIFNSGEWVWMKADMDGDGRIDRVQKLTLWLTRRTPQGFVTTEGSLVRIIFANGQIQTLRCPNVSPSDITIGDFDGDGWAEIWGKRLCDDWEKMQLTCWRYDSLKRRFVTAFHTRVRRPREGFCDCCGMDVAFVGNWHEWAIERDQQGRRWLFVPAYKRGRKVIARWQWAKGKWQPAQDIPMPHQDGFRLLWTGDGFLAFEWRRRPLIAILFFQLSDWVREHLREKPLYFRPAPSDLWVWQEGKGWRVIDHLTAYGYETAMPYWKPCGDLDGDGQSEVFVWELSGWWVGQWWEGKWRRSQSFKDYAEPVGILRDGRRRWLLCWDGKQKLMAVRLAE